MGRGKAEGGGAGATALRSRGGTGTAAAGGGCGRAAGRPRGPWRWRWSAAASCSALWGCARPAHRTVSADCGAPAAGHPTPGRGTGSSTGTPGASSSFAGMGPGLGAGWGLGRGPDGLACASGRALQCVWTGIEPGWAPGNGSPLCPDRTTLGQDRRGVPAPVPFRNEISAMPLSQYRTGRSLAVCPGTGQGRGPQYPSAPVPDGTSSVPAPPHHAGPAPAHFLRSHPSSLCPVATTPGVPRVLRSAPSRLRGFPGEPLIHGLRGSVDFTCRAGEPGSGLCPGNAAEPGILPALFVAAGSRMTPRECSPKRDPKVRVSRCHSSPTHPRARKHRGVIQSIILLEGKLKHGDTGITGGRIHRVPQV